MTQLPEDALRLIRYLGFKMDMLREQEENPLHLDIEQTKKNLDALCTIRDEKVEQLVKVMPKIPVMKSKGPPKVIHKADGTLSANGVKWFDFLKAQGLPEDTVGPVNYIVEYKEANPNSTPQVKDWLFSLGWKPTTFKFVRDGDSERRIEQVRKDGMLCPSVINLIDKEPDVELLDGLTVVNHRIGILKGFLSAQVDGKVVSSAGGLTNTLRMQHRAPIANLPSVDAAYGDMIRSVLVAPEGMEFCGADVSSLEDSLKQHFIYPHDPDYVDSMNQEGFDPHVFLAVDAGRVTQEDYDFYTTTTDKATDRYKAIHKIRKPMKTVNYACQYSVGSKTLARNSGMSVAEAAELIDVYWKRNWAVKAVAKEQFVKTLPDGSMWLKNPINGFFYSLRFEKDIFSTLVQGSGDYVFCLWTMFCRQQGLKISLNYHDEWLSAILKDRRLWATAIASSSMDKVNETLKLNKVIKMEAQFGNSYAACH